MKEKFSHDLSYLTEHWSVATVLALGGSLSFNIGYFYLPFGTSIFALSAQDLGITSAYIFFIAALVFNVFNQFENTFNLAGWQYRLVISAAIVGQFIPLVYMLYDTNWDLRNWRVIGAVLLLLSEASLLGILGVNALVKRRPDQHSTGVAATALLTFFGLFCFGIYVFTTDMTGSYPVTIVSSTREDQFNILTERGTFLIGVNIQNCEIIRIEKSSLQLIRKPAFDATSSSSPIDVCPLTKFVKFGK